MTEKCCKCGLFFPQANITLMLSKANSVNPFRESFYCCKKCYSEYRAIYEKYRSKLDSFNGKDWNKRYKEFWLGIFFGEFLKYSENPSFRTFTILK